MSAIVEYNALLAADERAAVEQAEWLAEAFRRRGITFGLSDAATPMASFLRPQLLDREAWNQLRDVGRRLLDLAVRVARAAFDGDVGRLCAYLGTPEAEARWVRIDPGEPDVVVSRLDAFLEGGGPRYIEINSDAPAGFGYGDRMAEVFAELPVFREFARRRPVSYLPSGGCLVDAVLALWGKKGDPGLPTVAIVDFSFVKTRADQEILHEVFEARGVRCFLADPREMEARDKGLWVGGERVDVVYRRGVLSELVEREDEVGGFLRAYREGLALFVNSLRCHLSEDKAFFALLTDEAFAWLLSEEEQAFVLRWLPWTRKLEERRTLKDGVEIDLVPWVLQNRPGLVLKPAHAYGGREVFVGDETEAATWEKTVAAGISQPWVVQQRVAIPEEPFPIVEGGRLRFEPLKVNANPFYVAGHEVGAIARVSRSSVINVSAGGGSIPTFVVG